MDISTIIANNIKSLRKDRKMTQTELAEKLNYSNKAVSRWESGEVIPDVLTLSKICEIFEIPLSSIFEENAVDIKVTKDHRWTIGNKLAISLLSIISVWFIATITFVCIKAAKNINIWQLFVWAVPASCIVAIVFNALWGRPMFKHVFLSLLLWSFLASLYLSLLKYNLWILFLIGIPVQAAIILWANITINNIKRKQKILEEHAKQEQNADTIPPTKE